MILKIIKHIACFILGIGMFATFPLGVVIAYHGGFKHPWLVCWRACTAMLIGDVDKFIYSNEDD